MGKKIAILLGMIGIVLLAIGFSGVLLKDTKIPANITLTQVFDQMEKSPLYKKWNQLGMKMVGKDPILFTFESYKLLVNSQDDIVTISLAQPLDTLLASFIYDSLGQLYGYKEGYTYQTVIDGKDYTLEENGLYQDNQVIKIDLSKKPIHLKKIESSEIEKNVNALLVTIKPSFEEIENFIFMANQYNILQQNETGILLTNQDITLELLALSTPTSCDQLTFDGNGNINFVNCVFEKGNYNYNGTITKYHADSVIDSAKRKIAENTILSYANAIETTQYQYYLQKMEYPNNLEELIAQTGNISMSGEKPEDCVVTLENGTVTLDYCKVISYSNTKRCSYHNTASCE